MPPLRERNEDIPLLAELFAAFGRRWGAASIRSRPTTCGARGLPLARQRPRAGKRGRARGGPVDRVEDRDRAGAARHSTTRRLGRHGARLRLCHPAILNRVEMLALERDNILRALDASNWKISGDDGAARLLDLPASTLSSRMKALEIVKPG